MSCSTSVCVGSSRRSRRSWGDRSAAGLWTGGSREVRNHSVTSIYLPSAGAHEWQWLLTSPGLHWKHGSSAVALADCWENSRGWPARVSAALHTDAALRDLELLLALPE